MGATDLASYFRHSVGPGWVLAGDAGHFKDPITAQGIRDALRFGRLLGKAVAPVLEDADALGRKLLDWVQRRDEECLETYHWTNRVAEAHDLTPVDLEFHRYFADPNRAHELLDLHSRILCPADVITTRRAALIGARALLHSNGNRRKAAAHLARDLVGILRR